MDIKINKIGLLMLATQFLVSISCNKDKTKPCTNATYGFAVTGRFYPEQEVFNIGDTLFFASSFATHLTDVISNQQVDYRNSVGVGGTINFILMDTVSRRSIESLSKFQLVSKIGSFSPFDHNPEAGITTNYLESDHYEFIVGIIVKQKGIYLIGANDLGSMGIKGNNCTNASFVIKVTNAEKHFNLFEHALGYTADASIMKNGYCFRVQ